MIEEWALIQSPAREQLRRLRDEENKIDGKLAQIDVSSLQRQAVHQLLS